MKVTLFGITLEIYRGLTPENVDRIARHYKGYDAGFSHKIYRIKAVRSIRKEISLKDAKEWVERNFDD